MSWSHEQVTMLLEKYEQHQYLCVVKHPLYKNRNARQKALEMISTDLSVIRPNTTPADIKTKFMGLRQTYMTEKRKCETSSKSGAGMNDVC